MWLRVRNSSSLQRAFVAERSELNDQQRKKWDATMQLRRDKEVRTLFTYLD